ncbi:carboxylate--amine ligase/circularly permuted type 2 ATP-grasp protein [Naasia sp. SYSU D00948]|uniref:carboxylate--amine ligase/circularly permuted type 2 ATP-grasp protein n=1 Tax=Naasia sp. SYSU D00948 TaxID=2817379 RepID=UPI001B30BF56|nr:carboxylate--amine ligase/circularly permuted type 2 ATP-grasp protein [Naasia sp. SYSU D00948]
MSAELTLGAEEELHLIDRESGKLAARAPQLLSRLPSESYSAELQRTTVETNTAVVSSLDDLRAELLRLRKGVLDAGAPDGVGIAAVGTAPLSALADFELTNTGRYGRMQEQYRLLVDEQLICGLQVHVGVSDRDLAVAIMQRVSPQLPVLLALSASSPFWNEHDTGYASIRSIIWQRWPTAGATGPVGSAAEYDALLEDLISSGVIADAKMAYFDVRPSAHAPTLELRICDACPLVDDAILVAGLFRAAVRAAELDIEAGRPFVPQAVPLHRAAMWQAARGGLSGKLLDGGEHPKPVPAPDAVRGLLAKLRPQLEELGDWDQVRELAATVVARGTSADRQRAAFAERGRLEDVVDLVVRETEGPAGGEVPAAPTLPGYRTRAGDEAVGLGSVPRAPYRDLLTHFRGLDESRLTQLKDAKERWATDRGLSFVVAGRPRPFDVDLLPRVITPHEWKVIEAGLLQRARALELFLQDVYTEQRVLKDGVISEDHLREASGWREEGRRLPPGTVRAAIIGFDLVRNEFGGWRVLEDNAQTPSGAAYAIAARELTDTLLPDLPRPPTLLDPRRVFSMLRETLAAGAREGALALVSPGPEAKAWYEHRRLAEGAGLLLIRPDDLDVADGVVRMRSTGSRIGALYLRLDDELRDLADSDGRAIGAELLAAAETGSVFLANAPGSGVADDKALYCAVPELINYYLGEHPLLDSVPTYRPENETERQSVLERVGELVTKPVNGQGGAGVLIGPAAPAIAVATRRAEILARPEAWVAQEVVPLSSLPTFSGARLEPRHIDLRVFVHVRGTGPGDVVLAPVGLTRVAPHGSMVVNSSRGGGAKDTWILGAEGDGDVRPGR